MSGPIVVNIPGAKLLSSKGSGANRRGHWGGHAKDTASHRAGVNSSTAKAIAAYWGGFFVELLHRKKKPQHYYAARRGGEFLQARRVTITRICPEQYFADGGDNLKSLCKPVLDGVADALGVNDKVFDANPTEKQIQTGWIALTHEQIAGDWGVRITIEPA